MNFLRNLSIRYKLVIMALIPLLRLMYYLKNNIIQELRNQKSASQVLQDVKDSVYGSDNIMSHSRMEQLSSN